MATSASAPGGWEGELERRPPKLDLTIYPCLPRVTVAATSPEAYMALLGQAA